MTTDTRKLALALLNDEHGISGAAYVFLADMLDNERDFDIIEAVEATDGRFYLPAGAIYE